MKTLRSIALAILIAVIVMGFAVSVIAPEMPRYIGKPDIIEQRNLPSYSAESVVIRNFRGDISIDSHDGAEISIGAEIRGYAVDGDIAGLRNYISGIINVSNSDNVLELVSEPEERPDAIELHVDYEILVPNGTNLDIINKNGDIEISRGCGKIDVICDNGGIIIQEPQGPVTAMTTNGRIRAWGIPMKASLNTVNGNIYAHMMGESLDAATVNGAIVAHVKKPEVSSCSLTSKNGGITVVLSDGCSAKVEALTYNGVVKSDFDVDTKNGMKKLRRLEGVIGEGRTFVDAKTLNGNIWFAGSES